ncbi:inositol-3-phosphate synthase [Acetobacteraceae bacterium]|nr:inositol-3-phosphate synthase [Acetobacteraceae bacterium]
MTQKRRISIAIAGVGNCASALIQGIHYYASNPNKEPIGLMHANLGGYKPADIDVVAAFDIDTRKVGKDLHEAIFEKPNCTTVFHSDLKPAGIKVQMGATLDGISEHMADYPDNRRFIRADQKDPTKEEVVKILKESGAKILLNYMPVGSSKASEFYAECALEAGLGFVNNIPVFIASNPKFAERFEKANLPIIGDDIKSQLGATITHRVLMDTFAKRGVKMDHTYQLNTGGNTDFLNMKNQSRLASKKISKTEAVQAVAKNRMEDEDIHVGPSDYVPWQNDNKIAFIRMEGRLFGDVPMNVELRLSVEDSPNSAGVAIDMIRCCQLALDHKIGGVLGGPSAYFCKHPPVQYADPIAYEMVENFIKENSSAE